MVDINLIGEDNIDEEKAEEVTHERTLETEQVDELSHTASMDTHELAFEERTETFDTTKTAGLSHSRSYSSSFSILMIAVGIVFVAALLWFFVFRDTSSNQQTELADLPPAVQQTGEVEPGVSEPSIQDPLAEAQDRPQDVSPEKGAESALDRTIPKTEPPTSSVGSSRTRDLPPRVTGDFVGNSTLGLESVTEVLTSMNGGLSTTLLSYASQKIRFEYVGASQQAASTVASQLNASFGSNDFSVLSEQEIVVAGQPMKKALISGTVSGAASMANGASESWDVTKVESWVKSTAAQFGLDIRQLKAQQSQMANGYIKTPLMTRLTGSKSALVSFMDAMAAQRLNVELTKILVVSPDMVTFTDQNLILVMNLFVYES